MPMLTAKFLDELRGKGFRSRRPGGSRSRQHRDRQIYDKAEIGIVGWEPHSRQPHSDCPTRLPSPVEAWFKPSPYERDQCRALRGSR